MRIHHDPINVETSDALKSQTFGIRDQDMSFIFDILRKKMYKNPINAICREISCNARDAHREIGTPNLPIEVTLPTKFSKQIEFKDFGPGINQKRMGEIFLNYGASTKRDSNKYTGAYGMGSKTPLSYSDTFSVVTIHGGKKRHYTAIIDESRLGRMDLLLEEDTTEHTGTTIIIPVKEQDFSAFSQALVNETKHWSEKFNTGARPKVLNLPITSQYPETKKPMLAGDDWELFQYKNSYNRYYSSSQMTIVIDGIGYEVSESDLELDRDKDRWACVLLSKDMNLYFPIGKLSLASNRDNIHFDDLTKKTILAKLKEVHKAVLQHAITKVEEQTNLAAAESFWSTFIEYMPSFGSTPKPSWRGITLKGPERKKKEGDNVLISRFGKDIRAGRIKRSNANRINLEENSKIIILDQDSTWGIYSKINRYIEENDLSSVHLVQFNDDVTKTRWVNEEDLEHLDYILSSTIPALTRKPAASYGVRAPRRGDFDAWIFDANYFGSKEYEHYWSPTTLEKRTGNEIYVVVNNKADFSFEAGEIQFSKANLKDVISAASEFLGTSIYCVRKRDLNNIGKDWERLDVALIPELKSKFENIDITQMLKTEEANSYTYQHIWGNLHRVDLKHLFRQTGANGLANKYYLESEEILETIKAQSENKKLYSIFGYLIDENHGKRNAIKHPLEKLMSSVIERYPLISGLDRYHSNYKMKDILEYIRMIDEKYAAAADSMSAVA